MIDSEFPYRWHVTLKQDDFPLGPVVIDSRDQTTIAEIKLAALQLYFNNSGFNTVPLPLSLSGFIARHTSPHAMLMMELRRDSISIPYTVTEL